MSGFPILDLVLDHSNDPRHQQAMIEATNLLNERMKKIEEERAETREAATFVNLKNDVEGAKKRN